MIPTVVSSVVWTLVILTLQRGGVTDLTSTALTMRAVILAMWPPIVMALLDPEDRHSAALLPSIVWMLLMWCVDAYSMVHAPKEHETGAKRTMGVNLHSHTVTAMSFGLCGLAGIRSDTKYIHFILYAMMLCIMFVLPEHNLHPDDPMRIFVDEAQRMCLMYCISLLITGIFFTRSIPTKAHST